MALGISAGAWLGAGTTVLGGLLGSKNKGTTQTQQNQIDPRIAAYIYGDGAGNAGLLSDARDLYGENKTGLNQQMVDGLNQQNAVYRSPLAQQGYERMGQTGYDLMGRGVAANPYTSGQMPQFGNWGARQQQQATPQQPTPTQQTQPTMQPASTAPGLNAGFSNPQAQQPFSMAPATAAPPAAPAPSQDAIRAQYEAEMRRQQQAWWADNSNNPGAGFGA